MKILGPLCLLVSCIGQRSITMQGTRALDCKILVKKQKVQFRKEMHAAKALHRRKPVGIPKKNNQPAGGAPQIADTPGMLAAPAGITFSSPVAYPSPLAQSTPETHIVNNIFSVHPANKKTSPAASDLAASLKITGNIGQVAFEPGAGVCLALGMGGIMGICLLSVFQKQAKGLSHWAKNNPWKARGAIAAAQLTAGAGCLILGNDLYDTGIIVPEYVRLAGAGLLASSAIFYPSKYLTNGAPAFHYLERKFYDAGLFTAGAILMTYAGNHYDITVQQTPPVEAVAYVSAPGAKTGTVAFAKKTVAIVKKEFKQKLNTLLQDPKEMTRGEKTALTILAVLGSIILTIGVSALSCNLACSGNDAAAVAVLVAGEGLIIWGLVATVRAIHRQRKKITTAEPQSAS